MANYREPDQSRQGQMSRPYVQSYRDEEMGQGYQMSDINGKGGYTEQDPNYILNECRKLEGDIDAYVLFKELRVAHNEVVHNGAPSSVAIAPTDKAVNDFKKLSHRFRTIKSNPRSWEPRNLPTVERLGRRLQAGLDEFRTVDAKFGRDTEQALVRNIKTINPNVTDEQLRYALEASTNPQVFQQALMSSGRQGQSRETMSAVRDRHAAIQKLEQTVIILAQLYEEVNAIVLQQEPVVAQINQQSEVVHENVNQANSQLDGAIKSARAANRKKWYCAGIVLLILIIIAIIIVLVIKVGLKQ